MNGLNILKALVAAAAATALVVLACNTAADEPPPPGGGGQGNITVEGISFAWAVAAPVVHFDVEAPTTGWVAAGFNPSSLMKGADLKIGYVDGAGVHIRDDYATDFTAHRADVDIGGVDNILSPAGNEAGGKTKISFDVPLNSGDAKDKVFVVNQTYTLMLAYGPPGADDFATHHGFRVKTTIKL